MWGKHTKSTTNAPKNRKDETAIRQEPFKDLSRYVESESSPARSRLMPRIPVIATASRRKSPKELKYERGYARKRPVPKVKPNKTLEPTEPSLTTRLLEERSKVSRGFVILGLTLFFLAVATLFAMFFN